MLLRVEDTDRERSSSELVENILASLRWLGLDWDGDIVFQADNLEAHREAALSLLGDGRAYWCDCTAEQIQARAKERGGPPGYDGHCRDRGLEQSADHRAALPRARRRHHLLHRRRARRGDLREQDHRGLRAPAVHRACRCSCSPTRSTTPRWASPTSSAARTTCPARRSTCCSATRSASAGPEVFAHLPMLVNEGRKKLSKRKDAVSVADFAAEGYLPEAMVNYLALLGWGPRDGVEIRPLEEIVEQFRLEDVTPSPAFFDVQEAPAHQRRVHPGAARRTSSSAGRARSSRAATRPPRRWSRSPRWCRSACACSPRSSR